MRFAVVATAGLLVAGAHGWPFWARNADPKIVTVTHTAVIQVYTTVNANALEYTSKAVAPVAPPGGPVVTVTASTIVVVTPTPVTASPVVVTPTATPTPVSNLPPKNDNPGYPKFIQWALDHHNIHRANHSAPPLVWDQALADTAMKLAQTCVYGHDT
jgi:uncharacterized protein YkwD